MSERVKYEGRDIIHTPLDVGSKATGNHESLPLDQTKERFFPPYHLYHL